MFGTGLLPSNNADAPYVYKEGPPSGRHWAKKTFGVETIMAHKYVADTQEYLFKVRWQRCTEEEDTWESPSSFNYTLSARRELITYCYRNLPVDHAYEIRIGSAKAKTK
jgi:hypothetical protein